MKDCRTIKLMASASFDFEQVTRVTAGAIGDPGKRAFYLQLRTAGELISLALEKDQLRTLTERLQEVFSRVSVPPADRLPEMALEEPIVGFEDHAQRGPEIHHRIIHTGSFELLRCSNRCAKYSRSVDS